MFDNDFAALLPPDLNPEDPDEDPFFQSASDDGICRVICFSPRHDLSIPELELEDVFSVIKTWSDQTEDLGSKAFINHVQIFENKGALMGCSNPHPHSQIWATRLIPDEPAKELKKQQIYFLKHSRTLLQDYLIKEVERKITDRNFKQFVYCFGAFLGNLAV